MATDEVFTLHQNGIYAVPMIHYNMETAAAVKLAFDTIKPDCVAVELAETMQLQLLHAASRLPDVSLVISYDQSQDPLYYLSEPCDAAFEGLRCALESQIPAFCIDLDVDDYPHMRDVIPDPYAIQRIGLKNYYDAYQKGLSNEKQRNPLDDKREQYMARRLKELSLSYERVLFIGGMFHMQRILKSIERTSFPTYTHAQRDMIELCTLTEESCREVMGEYGWISTQYEDWRRESSSQLFPPDRQKLIYQLFKTASLKYTEYTGHTFPGYHLRNIMKFARNYALINEQLMPDLFQILASAKGCVDHNYAYEVWDLATEYPHRKNIDSLYELHLTPEDIWGHSKKILFHMRQQSRKSPFSHRHRKDRSSFRFSPPGSFNICSYPPEDVIVERFGEFLKKKGTQLLTEEGARSVPFISSLEDGIDTRETLRHWTEGKLYVKMRGRPSGTVGSVVVIFDEDKPSEDKPYVEKYPWKTTWLGEHQQESDMAFYATSLSTQVVGPGISRCEYGGFMMSYPPRRLFDIWSDPDYQECRTKAELLLMAAIDYAVKPLVVYVAASPPRSIYKSFANQFGKKLVYLPITQLSPITLNKLRVFHVLDGHDKRSIADEYIF